MPEVWFIRHGESIANIGGSTRTTEEAMLTPKGHRQAQHIADYLHHETKGKLTRIVTSLYKRALQTAQPTQCFFAKTHFEVGPVHEFNYLALPANKFTSSTDRLPLVNDFWQRCNPSFHYQGAESFTQFVKRVQGVINEISTYENDQLIVVFSHQQFIQAVRWLLEQEPTVKINDLQAGEMGHFRHLLTTKPIPNGAILKTQLSVRKKQVLADLEVSHLLSETLRTTSSLSYTEENLAPKTLSLTGY